MSKINFKIPEIADFSGIKTFSVKDRTNLVTIENLKKPGISEFEMVETDEMNTLVANIAKARKNGRPVIFFMGAHVVKCGLSRYVIELIKKGIITHVATNGAGTIHDFELSYLGGTSEHVPTAIEDGSFGMWEETGRWMNEAIQEGAKLNLGYGQSLAEYMENNKERFPNREDSIVYQAYKNGIPATGHVTMGTDIIHQHPIVDFKAIGQTSGRDFKIIAESIKELEGGVFMNFGSAVTGAEVFLKALSIARNQGYETKVITTCNFDLYPLGDYKSDVTKDNFHYFYRPRKNIINRPVSLGGTGLYIQANHKNTIPTIYTKLGF